MTGKNKALGVIETMGLVPAIEAADTGLKTAEVTLDGLEMVGAGLVAIMLRGDVSSVKAAVAAGTLAAQRLGRVISTTVIARTAEGLEDIIGSVSGCEAAPQTAAPAALSEPTGETEEQPGPEQINLLSVVKLRAYARTLPGFSMSREEIRSARKQDLIDQILEYYRKM
jgi:microcompartment protein CcmL/EutN